MVLLQLEQEVVRRLDRLDFDRLWPGFRRRYEFAPHDTGWDMEHLAAYLVREMFRAHQREQEDGRFANELRAAGCVRPTPEYLQLHYEENLLLARLAERFDPAGWERFLSLRRTRQEYFPYEYDYERRVEATEGAAQYVGLEALRCLAPEKYVRSRELVADNVAWVWPLFSLRLMCRDTGAMLLMVLLENGFAVDQTIGPDAPFFGQALVDGAQPLSALPEPCPVLRAAIRDNEKTLRRRAARICTQCPARRRGNFRLLGFNSYDPQRLGSYIFSYGYLAYEDEKGERIILTKDCMFRMEGERLVEVIGPF